MTDDFQSLNKGIFVIPYEPPEIEPAGPSRPNKRLKKIYDETYQKYHDAHLRYEQSRGEEQLEEALDWMSRHDITRNTSINDGRYVYHRLPLAILQDASPSLPALIEEEINCFTTIQGKDIIDLDGCTRLLVTNLAGEEVSRKKSGRSGMDELEHWYLSQPSKSCKPILIFIQNLSNTPSHLLQEFLYVTSLHASIPVRILLEVSSIQKFLESAEWIEPESIEIAILGMGKKRKIGGVEAILREQGSRLSLRKELVQKLKEDEEMYGSGPQSTLRSLKWLFLRDSINSPLSHLVDANTQTELVNRILDDDASIESLDESVKEALLTVDLEKGLDVTMNPCPRISTLYALDNPPAYLKHIKHPDAAPPVIHNTSAVTEERPSAKRQSKRKRQSQIDVDSISFNEVNGAVESGPQDDRGDIKELTILFNVWRSAGKNLNLWDWLESFRSNITPHPIKEKNGIEVEGDIAQDTTNGIENGLEDEQREHEHGQDDHHDQEDDQEDEEKETRLHASFVRFCEEARMMGIVRAKGKKADEVVKSVGLV